MINYEPFWNTLKKTRKTTYTLINNYHVSSALVNRIRHNKPISTQTVNDLCIILDCQVNDIVCFIPNEYEKVTFISRKKIDN